MQALTSFNEQVATQVASQAPVWNDWYSRYSLVCVFVRSGWHGRNPLH